MKAELFNYMGDDLMVVNAARVSYGKKKTSFDEKDKKLIKYLIEHKHTSPFRHPQLQFRIECPIFVERQAFKHQVGLTANSISGRYVDFSDSYSLPQKLRLQSNDSKQGSEGFLNEEQNSELCKQIENLVDQCSELYAKLCDAGVAKEQSRVILPLCLNTQFVWTGSLAAFIHFWNLRLKKDAQQEIRELANMMLECVKNIEGNPFKHTLEAWDLDDII
jgi:thymidylate synthase (FAD)